MTHSLPRAIHIHTNPSPSNPRASISLSLGGFRLRGWAGVGGSFCLRNINTFSTAYHSLSLQFPLLVQSHCFSSYPFLILSSFIVSFSPSRPSSPLYPWRAAYTVLSFLSILLLSYIHGSFLRCLPSYPSVSTYTFIPSSLHCPIPPFPSSPFVHPWLVPSRCHSLYSSISFPSPSFVTARHLIPLCLSCLAPCIGLRFDGQVNYLEKKPDKQKK